MRHAMRLVYFLPVCLIGLPVIAQPYPITPLALEGDVVAGVGSITSIDNLAVNSNGDWMVEADTDNADSDADVVLLLNGALRLREGDVLPDPAGSTLDTFDSVNLNASGDSAWNFFIDGPPGDQDSGVYFNTSLVVQESDASSAPQFAAGTRYIGFFDAKLDDSNRVAVVASMDDPSIASTVDRAILRLTLDGGGALLSESAVAKESDVLPGQTEAVADFATGPHESTINDSGQILYFADLEGPTATDGVIYLDHRLVAQEGTPSPVAGRNYELLSSRGRDLNRHGDVLFKSNIDGTTANDELIVRNDEVVARERQMHPATFGFFLTGFGTGSGPVQIDDHRNALWFGEWSDPDADVNSGLFLNDLLLVQEGVTMIGGVVVDTINSGTDAFAMSDNGRFIVFEATLLDGTNGAFMIEVEPPPPVPDGHVVPGTALTAGLNVNGVDIDVKWDATQCAGDDYHLVFGSLADVGEYTLSGSVCNLGSGGDVTFSPPAGDLYWVVVAVDASNVEGAHGFDSGGAPRPSSSGGLCGVDAQVNTSSCP